jgi:hypothetical protein
MIRYTDYFKEKEGKGNEMSKCEMDGCQQHAEFFDPKGNRLCSDCIQRDVETAEYTWDDCAVIDEKEERPRAPSPKCEQNDWE